MDQNPYAVQRDPSSSLPSNADPTFASQGETMVNQVMVIGILQIFVGLLELMMSGFFLFYAVILPFVMSQAAKEAEAAGRASQDLPPAMMTGMVIYLAVFGVLILIFSILRIVSGIKSFYFQGRTLMIASLMGGLISIGSCYCSITAIGLAIYGMIVMVHPSVKYAYDLAKNGWKPFQIKDHFAIARLQRYSQGLPTANGASESNELGQSNPGKDA